MRSMFVCAPSIFSLGTPGWAPAPPLDNKEVEIPVEWNSCGEQWIKVKR